MNPSYRNVKFCLAELFKNIGHKQNFGGGETARKCVATFCRPSDVHISHNLCCIHFETEVTLWQKNKI